MTEKYKDVTVQEAILHSLEEAYSCVSHWNFCASTAMLRKAIDLWSGWYRGKHSLPFDKQKGESDNIFWRLRKISDQNPLYKDSIHKIIDGLRLSANDVMHDKFICFKRGSGRYEYDASDIMRIEGPHRELWQLVCQLINTTMPNTHIET